jgi:hypothetical protein
MVGRPVSFHSVRCLVTFDRKVRGDEVIRRRHVGRRLWEKYGLKVEKGRASVLFASLI